MDSLWVSWGAVGGGEDIEKGQSFFKKNINGPRCIAFASVFFFFPGKFKCTKRRFYLNKIL